MGFLLEEVNALGGPKAPLVLERETADMDIITGGVEGAPGVSWQIDSDGTLTFFGHAEVMAGADGFGSLYLDNDVVSVQIGNAALNLIRADNTFNLRSGPDQGMRLSVNEDGQVSVNPIAGQKTLVTSELEIDGVLNHDGAQVGLFGKVPVAQPAAIANANEAHGFSVVYGDVEHEAALNALAVKLNAALAALRALGAIAT